MVIRTSLPKITNTQKYFAKRSVSPTSLSLHNKINLTIISFGARISIDFFFSKIGVGEDVNKYA